MDTRRRLHTAVPGCQRNPSPDAATTAVFLRIYPGRGDGSYVAVKACGSAMQGHLSSLPRIKRQHHTPSPDTSFTPLWRPPCRTGLCNPARRHGRLRWCVGDADTIDVAALELKIRGCMHARRGCVKAAQPQGGACRCAVYGRGGAAGDSQRRHAAQFQLPAHACMLISRRGILRRWVRKPAAHACDGAVIFLCLTVDSRQSRRGALQVRDCDSARAPKC